ncbi:hypothetical protein U1Q18_010890 [Sarracenia purpurea var. burkii]
MRSFLEKKGLTKEEIDEAFRRVPDPPQNVSSAQPTELIKIKIVFFLDWMETSAAAPAGVNSTNGTQTRFHWSRALLAVGFLALSGAGTAILFKVLSKESCRIMQGSKMSAVEDARPYEACSDITIVFQPHNYYMQVAG